MPTQNPFSPYSVGDVVGGLPASNGVYAGLPVTTQVRYRGLGDVPRRFSKTTFTDYMFDFGVRGELGWLGDYFTKIMKPGADGKIANRMQAPRNHRPRLVFDRDSVINEFLEQQFTLLNLLHDAKRKDIGAIRTPVSISKLIKLKTGDTFSFLIAHDQRHLIQIDNTLKQIIENEVKLGNLQVNNIRYLNIKDIPESTLRNAIENQIKLGNLIHSKISTKEN